MIENGIIKEEKIYDAPFKVDLIPKENKTSRPAFKMTPTSITIHETGNKSQSADARMHTKYVDNTKNYVSWHFTVDDNIIIQELPILENAWHAGDGSRGKGNRTSIAIEICVNEGIDFEKAKLNAIKLIHYLRKNVNTIGNIYQHNHWNGKNCPRRIRKSGWDKFMNKVDQFEPFIEIKTNWKIELGTQAIKDLDKKGLINSTDMHIENLKKGIIEPWLIWEMFNRLSE